MLKRTLLILFLGSLAIFMVQCSQDDTPESIVSPNIDTLPTISGITQTNDLGIVEGGDLNDWCYTSPKSATGTLPTEYALYPAFPNASYYYVNLIYDLPVQSVVSLAIMDTSRTVVRTLVNSSQAAGQYVTGWDLRDSLGTRVSPGIYRVLIKAGDFQCFGDIEVLPVPQPDSGSLVITTGPSDDGMAVTYDSPVPVAALWLVFILDGGTGAPVYDPVTAGMNVRDNLVQSATETQPDTLKIIMVTPVDRIVTMPEGSHYLCDIPVTSGRLSLDYVEASNEMGQLIPAAIIKTQ